MSIILHHHPQTRAATVVWQLEEIGVPYTLRHHDLSKGEHKNPELLALSPMGKVPVLQDGEVVVTETAAIGLYLADRFAPVRLAPALDDPARGAYLRWSLFPSAVIEPACLAKASSWHYRAGTAGWGRYEDVLDTIDHALRPGPWILGERFSMADIIFGSTIRFMMLFKMLEPRDSYAAYVRRLEARPAIQRAMAVNQAVIAAHTPAR